MPKKGPDLRTKAYFQERARRANRAETLRILKKAGKGNPPVKGDELPPGWPEEYKVSRTVSRQSANEKSHRVRSSIFWRLLDLSSWHRSMWC